MNPHGFFKDHHRHYDEEDSSPGHYYQTSSVEDDMEEDSMNQILTDEYRDHRSKRYKKPFSSPNEPSIHTSNIHINHHVNSETDFLEDENSLRHQQKEGALKSPLLKGRKFKASLPSKIKYFNKGFVNVVILGFSFLILFSAFNIILFYFSEIRKRITTASVVLYASLSGSSLITPSILKLIGLRSSIIVGALLYSLFVLSLCFDLAPITYTCSCISGLGASLLWISHGEILTRSANYYQRIATKERNKMELDYVNSIYMSMGDKPIRFSSHHADGVMGLFSGVFFGIYALNSVFGNLISTSLVNSDIDYFWLFLILFIVSLIGSLLLLPLRNISFHETISNVQWKQQPRKVKNSSNLRNNDSSFRNLETGRTSYPKSVIMKSNSSQSITNDSATINNDTDDEDSSNLPSMFDENESVCTIEYELPKPPSRRDKIISIVRDICENIKSSFLVLFSVKIVLFGFIFCYSGYSIAFFYRSLPKVMQKHSHTFLVPWAIACFGITEMVGSLIFGRLCDKIGKRPIMILTLCLHVLAIAASFATVYWPPSYYNYFIPLLVCGCADSGLNVVIYSVVGGTASYFKHEKTIEAFASFRLIQSMAICVGIVFGERFSVQTIQLTLSGLLCLCILFYIILDFCFYPFDSKKSKFKKKESVESRMREQPYF
ncbi:hypothetical protein FDP41_005141 [Naegleria fowleri]|uniref:Major facilitator superfamily (MFS) profile domain-containing protein n=1 Tax=Naegleria fowleri TaxID=5763 RepID=A0A6A5BNY9_NAEFO|nr:uncharacterized protein FDP41_005141 [Naegleria fowleri]KAF0975814.1 hypothetical protein FDP41_005141 [Naegleria fowleri]